MKDTALSDLRVIELGDFISAPYCAKLLADLGAEVIKVERPGLGDISRRLGPFPGDMPHLEKSGLFIYLNTNKLGITLDIDTATGRKILKELLRDADVLVESNPLKTLEEWGLDYEALRKINPRLVMTSITPYGHTGPYRHHTCYDINISAASGLTAPQGFPGREPLTMPANQCSYYAGTTAAAATMVATYARNASNRGQHVDISQVRCWATTDSVNVSRFVTDQAVRPRTGRQMPGVFPYTVMPIKDGMIVMVIVTEGDWQAILDMMGKPEWAADAKFQTQYSRYEHREEVMSLMKPWLMSHTRAEILKLSLEAGAFRACAPLQTVDEMVNSEHLKDRDFFVDIEHPEAGKLKCSGAPYRLTHTPWAIKRRAPLLGEHNGEVYCRRLGYTIQDLARLRAAGVV